MVDLVTDVSIDKKRKNWQPNIRTAVRFFGSLVLGNKPKDMTSIDDRKQRRSQKTNCAWLEAWLHEQGDAKSAFGTARLLK